MKLIKTNQKGKHMFKGTENINEETVVRFDKDMLIDQLETFAIDHGWSEMMVAIVTGDIEKERITTSEELQATLEM